MALLPANEIADKLITEYYDLIREECMANPNVNGGVHKLAAKLTIKHCDDMIQFIDTQMQGFLDWDMKAHYESVKQYCNTKYLNIV